MEKFIRIHFLTNTFAYGCYIKTYWTLNFLTTTIESIEFFSKNTFLWYTSNTIRIHIPNSEKKQLNLLVCSRSILADIPRPTKSNRTDDLSLIILENYSPTFVNTLFTFIDIDTCLCHWINLISRTTVSLSNTSEKQIRIYYIRLIS